MSWGAVALSGQDLGAVGDRAGGVDFAQTPIRRERSPLEHDRVIDRPILTTISHFAV